MYRINDLTITSKALKSGGFGKIKDAQWKKDDGSIFDVVVKEFKNEADFSKERDIFTEIRHCNIVHIFGYFRSNSSIPMLVMEKGLYDLHENIKNGSKTPLTVILDLIRAMNYLHNESRKCIIHLDIKPNNIMIFAAGAKLVDFGISIAIRKSKPVEKLSYYRGTLGYMP